MFFFPLVSPCGMWNIPDQELNLRPLQWKHGGFTTGPLVKSPNLLYLFIFLYLAWIGLQTSSMHWAEIKSLFISHSFFPRAVDLLKRLSYSVECFTFWFCLIVSYDVVCFFTLFNLPLFLSSSHSWIRTTWELYKIWMPRLCPRPVKSESLWWGWTSLFFKAFRVIPMSLFTEL